MQPLRLALIALVAATLAGCASIPPEAPALSGELGARIAAIESAHTRLVEQFFAEKRDRVDAFVQEEWVPVFAAEFFGDPKIDAVWKEVVKSDDPQDRLRFITLVGPRLQARINAKRLELIKPLEDLERHVKSRLKAEYDQARAINTTLTAFLTSAARVDENRRRYLELAGLKDARLAGFIDATDAAVSALVIGSRKAEDKAQDAEAFVSKVRAIIDDVRSRN